MGEFVANLKGIIKALKDISESYLNDNSEEFREAVRRLSSSFASVQQTLLELHLRELDKECRLAFKNFLEGVRSKDSKRVKEAKETLAALVKRIMAEVSPRLKSASTTTHSLSSSSASGNVKVEPPPFQTYPPSSHAQYSAKPSSPVPAKRLTEMFDPKRLTGNFAPLRPTSPSSSSPPSASPVSPPPKHLTRSASSNNFGADGSPVLHHADPSMLSQSAPSANLLEKNLLEKGNRKSGLHRSSDSSTNANPNINNNNNSNFGSLSAKARKYTAPRSAIMSTPSNDNGQPNITVTSASSTPQKPYLSPTSSSAIKLNTPEPLALSKLKAEPTLLKTKSEPELPKPYQSVSAGKSQSALPLVTVSHGADNMLSSKPAPKSNSSLQVSREENDEPPKVHGWLRLLTVMMSIQEKTGSTSEHTNYFWGNQSA